MSVIRRPPPQILQTQRWAHEGEICVCMTMHTYIPTYLPTYLPSIHPSIHACIYIQGVLRPLLQKEQGTSLETFGSPSAAFARMFGCSLVDCISAHDELLPLILVSSRFLSSLNPQSINQQNRQNPESQNPITKPSKAPPNLPTNPIVARGWAFPDPSRFASPGLGAGLPRRFLRV